MKAQAIAKSVGMSPRKVRLVVDLIRGRNVNEGPRLKRFRAAAMGRAAPRIKRSSQITIVVDRKE